jgi:chitinase
LTSLGGAAGSDQIAAQVRPATLGTLVSHVVQHVDEYGFDGVDVDIEGDAVNESYGAFVDALSAELKPRGKLLTAAVANWYEERIAPATLLTFDYIGVMAYDACGSWTDPCDHSTLALAEDNLAFWVGTRGMPANKTTLGVPFYGRSWGDPSAPDTIGYSDIITRYPDAWQKDWIEDGAYRLSYNGEATIRAKVELARQHGGIMIWELGNDALGQRSLLRVIDDSF